MPASTPVFATLEDWVAREAIPFSPDAPEAVNAAVDAMVASLGAVELLGFGEALHGGEDILQLRNRLFQRLVEAHGFSAIAVESSFPRGHLVDEFVAGRGPASYDELQEAGFSHGFGRLQANRELVEWMRQYNVDPSHSVRLRFYGFDNPSEMTVTDSPRRLLHFALDYFAELDSAGAGERRGRIDALLGEDSIWENPEAAFDPAKSVGLTPEATALRIETEDLVTDLRLRRPEAFSAGDADRYREALQHVLVVRHLLDYHAGVARDSPNRISELLGIRDLVMADNLEYAVSRERGRGKVLAFAHNSHLQRGTARMQLGPYACAWWPAGAHVHAALGPRYAVIGTAVGVSDENGIGEPEAGTLEARLTAAPGPARFIPTHRGEGMPAPGIESLPVRSGSVRNGTFYPLTAQSFADFDWLAVLDATAYTIGGPPLP